MGLNVTSMPVYNGAAVITGLYGNVRDIRVNKNDDGKFEIQFFFNLYKTVDGTSTNIKNLYISKTYDNDFLNKTWGDAYTIVKEHLTSLGIEFTDDV